MQLSVHFACIDCAHLPMTRLLENLRTNIHPTDTAVASPIRPSSVHQNRAYLKKTSIHELLRRYDPSNSPTRFPADPSLFVDDPAGLSVEECGTAKQQE
jgi:hypothetical protein